MVPTPSCAKAEVGETAKEHGGWERCCDSPVCHFRRQGRLISALVVLAQALEGWKTDLRGQELKEQS